MAQRPMVPDFGPPAAPVMPPVNAPTPDPITTFVLPADAGRIIALGFAADGVTLAVGTDADVAVWVNANRIGARSPGRAGPDRLVPAAVSADGSRVAFARNGGPLVYLDRQNPRAPGEVGAGELGGSGQGERAFCPA